MSTATMEVNRETENTKIIVVHPRNLGYIHLSSSKKGKSSLHHFVFRLHPLIYKEHTLTVTVKWLSTTISKCDIQIKVWDQTETERPLNNKRKNREDEEEHSRRESPNFTPFRENQNWDIWGRAQLESTAEMHSRKLKPTDRIRSHKRYVTTDINGNKWNGVPGDRFACVGASLKNDILHLEASTT